MTTGLSGYKAETSPGSISASTTYQYSNPEVLFETTLKGTMPVQFAGVIDPPQDWLLFESRLAAKLLSRAQEQINQFQGGVFLGELREAIQLVRRPLSGFRDLLVQHRAQERGISRRLDALNRWYKAAIKRASDITVKKERLRRLKAIERTRKGKLSLIEDAWASIWLELNYAVLPLVSDVQSAIAQYNRIQDNGKDAYVTATLEDFISSSDVSRPNGYFAWSWRETPLYEARIKGRAKAKVTVLANGGFFNPANYGLSLSNTVPTLYELTPWTFLLDYITNVNEILNASCVESGNIVYSWLGVEQTQSAVILCSDFIFHGDGNPSLNYEPWRYDVRTVNRSDALSHTAWLGYTIEFPSWKQAINVAALRRALGLK